MKNIIRDLFSGSNTNYYAQQAFGYSNPPSITSSPSELIEFIGRLLQKIEELEKRISTLEKQATSHQSSRNVIHIPRRNDNSLRTLDSIPGLREDVKHNLLSHFATIDNIRLASIEELCRVKGIQRATAEKIKAFLNA